MLHIVIPCNLVNLDIAHHTGTTYLSDQINVKAIFFILSVLQYTTFIIYFCIMPSTHFFVGVLVPVSNGSLTVFVLLCVQWSNFFFYCRCERTFRKEKSEEHQFYFYKMYFSK